MDELKLIKEKFLELQIDDLLSSIEEKTYLNYSGVFFEYCKNTKNEIYQILYKICIIQMHITSNNKVTYDNSMLYKIENISEMELNFFDEILESISDNLLKARLADFLFIRRKNHKYAKIAIDSFSKIKLENNYNSILIWSRIVDILSYIKSKDENLINKLYDIVFYEINNNDFNLNNEEYFRDLFSIIIKYPLKNEDYNIVLSKIDNIFNGIKNTIKPDYTFIIDEYITIIDFILKDDIKKYNYYNDIARYYINAKEDGLKKNTNLDKAISIFYKMNSNYRRNFISDEELGKLHIAKKKSNMEEISNMFTHEFKIKINIDDVVNEFENYIKSFNYEPIKSLQCFLDFIYFDYYNINPKFLEPQIVDFIAIKSIYDKDKLRHVSNPDYKDNEEEFKLLKKREHYHHHILSVYFFFGYRKRVLEFNCNIDYKLIYNICLYSGIIKNDRVYIFAHGLFLCYKDDYVAGLSILVPQIEDWIRYLLNVCGVNTRNKDRYGKFEKELSLDEMLKEKKDDIISIFGESLYFELNTLLSNEDYCLNLRNNLCHGLINVNDFYSQNYVYLWALIFRFILLSYIQNKQDNKTYN
ncbi:hypothetical protein BHWA1_01317 [Brachyspira hyodysenteriae WA1]|uniref:Uncharacterized protein n=1 Tax=Brachyspira hyodysenteriae (strain ATCC 49526 / WA1) TaxID=565034 RepID=A0A3B6VIK2_BRAHW|nr:DUF4209 domain-containing protein [Brachyspira hyodysenteriae]ACN83796.1 hypothetical protein BHWA1_01317 [Brachyspira hyodysenteriae WA1]